MLCRLRIGGEAFLVCFGLVGGLQLRMFNLFNLKHPTRVVVACTACATRLFECVNALAKWLIGKHYLLQIIVVELFDNAVAAEHEYIARCHMVVRYDFERGLGHGRLMRLHSPCDDVALWTSACFGFGQLARRYQVVDKRVVACLVYHTLALSELVNAAVANVRQQYAIGANGQECKRGAHGGLASTAVVKLFVECVKLTIGFG